MILTTRTLQTVKLRTHLRTTQSLSHTFLLLGFINHLDWVLTCAFGWTLVILTECVLFWTSAPSIGTWTDGPMWASLTLDAAGLGLLCSSWLLFYCYSDTLRIFLDDSSSYRMSVVCMMHLPIFSFDYLSRFAWWGLGLVSKSLTLSHSQSSRIWC